jgi:NAD+ synthase (glutamine-hydrolysing)
MKRRAYAGAEIIINVSASPFRVGIENTRKEMLATRSADYQVTTVYCNLLGGNDGLVFDGGGYVVQNGRTVFVAPRFHQGVTSTVIDLDKTSRGRMESTTWREDQRDYLVNCPDKPHRIKIPSVSKTSERPRYPVPAHANFFLPAEGHVVDVRTRFCEEILSALVLGLGDYFEKVGSFQKIGVALSGGRDSALCLIIAREYVDRRYSGYSKRERDEISRNMIRAFFMPSRHTSAKTTAAARQLAADLGVPLVEHSIEDAFTIEETAARALLSSGESLSRLARQNIQARLRAQRMWTWSNSSAGLFLQTSNMSEKAVGYTTIGGDLEGALSVIANLPKTVVNYILEFLKERTGSRGIALTLEAPASAELDDDQEDERDLMPFPVLDACISLYAGERLAGSEVAECLSLLFPQYTSVQCKDWASRFIRLFTNSVYKWAQSPPAIHIGNIDLDRERALQLPIVQKLEW